MADTKDTTQPTDSEAFPAPTSDQIVDARAEGVVDAIKESAKDAYKAGADQGYADNPTDAPKFVKTHDVFNLQPRLDMGLDAFKAWLNPDKDDKSAEPLSEGQIAGLIEVERSGKNRTDYVKALCDRLGIKSPYEVTDAGPGYTNDTTTVSPIER